MHHYVELVIAHISVDRTYVSVQLVIDSIIKLVSVCDTSSKTAEHYIRFLLSQISMNVKNRILMVVFLNVAMWVKSVTIQWAVMNVNVVQSLIQLELVCVCRNDDYTVERILLINVGVLLDNPNLCNNDTCTGNSGTVLCLHGTVNVNNDCICK
jgi:hypothetical protein